MNMSFRTFACSITTSLSSSISSSSLIIALTLQYLKSVITQSKPVVSESSSHYENTLVSLQKFRTILVIFVSFKEWTTSYSLGAITVLCTKYYRSYTLSVLSSPGTAIA